MGKAQQVATGAVLAHVLRVDVAEAVLSGDGRVHLANGMALLPEPPGLDPCGVTEIPVVEGARLGVLGFALPLAGMLAQLGGGDPTRRAFAVASAHLPRRQAIAASLVLALERSIRTVASELEAEGNVSGRRLAELLAGAEDVDAAGASWRAQEPSLINECEKLHGSAAGG